MKIIVGHMQNRFRLTDLCYVATPYSKFPDGIEAAFRASCVVAGELLKRGLRVYSPIAHTHPIAEYAKIDLFDHDIWLPFDEAMMNACGTLIVAQLPGWEDSRGIAHEIEYFRNAGKPRFDLPCAYES